MINKDIIKKAKEVPMQEVFEGLGFQVNRAGASGKVICPFHAEDTASAVIGGKYNVLHCFGCGAVADNIKVVMQVNRCDFSEAVDYLTQSAPATTKETKKDLEPTKTPRENYIEALKKFRPSTANIRPTLKAQIRSHLEERHLLNATDILHRNGYDIGVIESNIAYKLNGFIIVRYPNNKANYGRPALSSITVDKSSKTLYICEGVTDALAVAEMGHNSIIIHSTRNVDKLIYRLKNSKAAQTFNYVIATDNDNSGLEAKEKLEAFFIQHNFNFEDCLMLRNSKHKDVGELYADNHKVML